MTEQQNSAVMHWQKAAGYVKYAGSVLCVERCKGRTGLATQNQTVRNTAILLSTIF